jgi:type II secretory pathway pseudopilin PulG
METVVVMVIVGIMSAVAIVKLTNATDNRSRMAARMLQRDLTYAKQRAMATGLTVWVVFDVGAETWTLKDEDPMSPGPTDAVTFFDPATGGDYVQTLGSGRFVGVTITTAVFDGGAEIGFNWQGEPVNNALGDLAAQGVVTLNDGSQVTVEPETGYAYYAPP